MNDRYLFRGKRCYDDQWIVGNLINPINGDCCIIPCDEFEEDGHHLMISYDEPIFTDPKTIGQCTGLKDKNGKLMFEGDIVRFDALNGHNCVIEHNQYLCKYEIKGKADTHSLSSYNKGELEIIGNIHEEE